MNETIHVLATVRQPELLRAALLVLRTWRIGFPDGRLMVWGNGLEEGSPVQTATRAFGGVYAHLPDTSHDGWVEGLIQRSLDPFWICDTDVVFFDRMEAPERGASFAGRLEPGFCEEWTRTLHVERLHTAVMWINPVATRQAMRSEIVKVPVPWRYSAEFPLVRQTFVPHRNGPTQFYDTMAGLWQAGFGTPFTAEQDAAFEHLHCATYIDQIGPHLGGGELKAVHDGIYEDPARARGLAVKQAEYYASRRPNGIGNLKLEN